MDPAGTLLWALSRATKGADGSCLPAWSSGNESRAMEIGLTSPGLQPIILPVAGRTVYPVQRLLSCSPGERALAVPFGLLRQNLCHHCSHHKGGY